jgi:excisionase family DNA binding protein
MPSVPVDERGHHARIAYSPAQAAAELGCSRQTIHALIKRGELRRFKVGRLTKIPAADVHALVGFEPTEVGDAG